MKSKSTTVNFYAFLSVFGNQSYSTKQIIGLDEPVLKGLNVHKKLVDSSSDSRFIAFQQYKTQLKGFFDVIHADRCNHFVIIILHTFKKIRVQQNYSIL